MRELFYELIQEAKEGKVLIDGEEWPIGFDTTIYNEGKCSLQLNGNNLSMLRITDEEAFFNLLSEYILLELSINRKSIPFLDRTGKSQIKYLLAYLFVNATTEDFFRPEEFIKKGLNF